MMQLIFLCKTNGSFKNFPDLSNIILESSEHHLLFPDVSYKIFTCRKRYVIIANMQINVDVIEYHTVNSLEPRHEKTCFSHMRTTKVQISLRIRAA